MIQITREIKQAEKKMGNSHTRDSEISEERRSSRCGPAGASTPDSASDQRQKCFRDIMDLVLQLSDEEWKAVSRGMEKEVSRLEFVAACTKIVSTVSSTVVRRLMTPLSESFGIEAILEANDKLKKMESNSNKCSAPDASAQSSPMEASDFICELSQRIVTEIKGAMLAAIRSTASGPGPSCSARASSLAGDRISQLDDLSITCTNEICERILALYLSEECVRPGGETTSGTSLKSHQEVHGIMKGLEEVVSISRSSSWSTVTSTVTTTPEPEAMTPDGASSAPRAERPFSEQFLSKASQAISEILLKTEQKLATSMSPQISVPASSGTELNFLMELVKSTATEILQKLFFILVHSLREHLTGVSSSNANQSGPEREQRFLSDAQTIHMDIHKQVFSFICERQQAVSEKRNSLLDFCSETASQLDVSSENIQESAAAELFLKATNAASDILVKKLSSHDSTVKSSGSSTVSSLMKSVDLDHVASDIINKVISRVALEVRITVMKIRQEAQVGDADAHSALDSKSSSGFSGIEDQESVQQFIDAERKPLPSAPNRPYVSRHFFIMVRDRLKAFFSSLTAADDESDENPVVSIYISEDGTVHELTEPDISQNLKDPFLEKSNKMFKSVHFPSDFIDNFEEEQNVLYTGSSDWSDGSDGHDGSDGTDGSDGRDGHDGSDGSDWSDWSDGRDGCSPHAAEDQEKKQRPRVHVDVKGISDTVKRPVKHQRKQKKQRRSRVPVQRVVQPSTSAPPTVHYASDRESRSSRTLFKNTRRTLGRIFSNISKTFTCCFIPDTA
ncbi:hypothetical protein QTP70_021309, partial [Hemibagrus guttatus]